MKLDLSLVNRYYSMILIQCYYLVFKKEKKSSFIRILVNKKNSWDVNTRPVGYSNMVKMYAIVP